MKEREKRGREKDTEQTVRHQNLLFVFILPWLRWTLIFAKKDILLILTTGHKVDCVFAYNEKFHTNTRTSNIFCWRPQTWLVYPWKMNKHLTASLSSRLNIPIQVAIQCNLQFIKNFVFPKPPWTHTHTAFYISHWFHLIVNFVGYQSRIDLTISKNY